MQKGINFFRLPRKRSDQNKLCVFSLSKTQSKHDISNPRLLQIIYSCRARYGEHSEKKIYWKSFCRTKVMVKMVKSKKQAKTNGFGRGLNP